MSSLHETTGIFVAHGPWRVMRNTRTNTFGMQYIGTKYMRKRLTRALFKQQGPCGSLCHGSCGREGPYDRWGAGYDGWSTRERQPLQESGQHVATTGGMSRSVSGPRRVCSPRMAINNRRTIPSSSTTYTPIPSRVDTHQGGF